MCVRVCACGWRKITWRDLFFNVKVAHHCEQLSQTLQKTVTIWHIFSTRYIFVRNSSHKKYAPHAFLHSNTHTHTHTHTLTLTHTHDPKNVSQRVSIVKFERALKIAFATLQYVLLQFWNISRNFAGIFGLSNFRKPMSNVFTPSQAELRCLTNIRNVTRPSPSFFETSCTRSQQVLHFFGIKMTCQGSLWHDAFAQPG